MGSDFTLNSVVLMAMFPSSGSSTAWPSWQAPWLTTWGSRNPKQKADQTQQIITSTTDSRPATSSTDGFSLFAFLSGKSQSSPDEIHERPGTAAARAPSPSMKGDVPDPDQQADKPRTPVAGASSHSMEATSSSAAAVAIYEPDEDVHKLTDRERAVNYARHEVICICPQSSLAREAAMIGSEEKWKNRSRGNDFDVILKAAQEIRTGVAGILSLPKEENPKPSKQTSSEPQSRNHMPHKRTQHQTSQGESHPRKKGAGARVGAQSGLGPIWAHRALMCPQGPYGSIWARLCLKILKLDENA